MNNGGRHDESTNLHHRNIIRLRNHSFNHVCTHAGASSPGDGDPTGADNGDVQKTLQAGSLAGGLEHGGEGDAAVRQVKELLDVVVVEHHVQAQDLLDHVRRSVCNGGHGSVVDDEDGDDLAVVDLVGEVGLNQVVVVGSEFWEWGEDLGDVESR